MYEKKAVYTSDAPAPAGPYSQAIVTGSFVFVSGQLGITSSGELPESVTEQAEAALNNMRSVLQAAGARMDDVVKTTVLLADMNDFKAVNKLYADYFTEPFPARVAYQVAALPLGAMVEIEAVARLKER
ncbi:reactive intermediate/imine deaminase [Candidatus Fermentibacteria bacterium]|nr:MAG: reactive intermediate/imine deaminase [Candidatus Fermentibacteria bacterium]